MKLWIARFHNYRILFVLAVSAAFGQVLTAQTAEQGMDTPEARAQAVREAVVETYGTPEQIEVFHHPRHDQPGLTTKDLNVKKMRTPAGREEFTRKLNANATPEQTFDTVFTAAMIDGFAIKEKGDAENKTTHPTQAHRLLRFLEGQLLSQLPLAGGSAESAIAHADSRAMDQAAEAAKRKRLTQQGEARMATAAILVRQVLTAEDVEEYDHGDYAMKASKLFKATYTILGRQRAPNAYTLWLCDMAGENDLPCSQIQEDILKVRPQDARFSNERWEKSSMPERWAALVSFYEGLAREMETDLRDPHKSHEDLSVFFSKADFGSEPPEDRILGSLGSDGLKQYQAANGEKRELLRMTADLTSLGFSFLMPSLIGDPGDEKM